MIYIFKGPFSLLASNDKRCLPEWKQLGLQEQTTAVLLSLWKCFQYSSYLLEAKPTGHIDKLSIGVRKSKELKMTLQFLTQGTGKRVSSFSKKRKTMQEASLGVEENQKCTFVFSIPHRATKMCQVRGSE